MVFNTLGSSKSLIRQVSADATNKEKRSIRLSNARIRGSHSKQQWLDLVSFCGQCVKCGATEYHLEKDHIVPVYQGGCDCIHNVQPLCALCNASKGPDTSDYRPEGWEVVSGSR